MILYLILFLSFKTGYISSEVFIPTIFDNYSANIMFDDTPIDFQLWDTAGQESYKKIRPLSYNQIHL